MYRMSRVWLPVLLWLSCMLSIESVWAERRVEGLYQSSVPVADQSQTLRESMLASILAGVIDKVTGRSGWRAQLPDSELAAWAPSLMEEYSYQRRSAENGESLNLSARFSEALLSARLAERGIPVWGTIRPTVLVWLAVENDGVRQILSENPEDLTAQTLLAFGGRWGLPLQLPLMDLDDRNALNPSDLWGFFVDAVQPASQRYQPQFSLLARAFRQGSRWLVQWKLVDSLREVGSGENVQGSLELALGEMVTAVASTLSQRYAVMAGAQVSDQILIEVTQLQNYEDYARCLKMISSLAPVSNAAPVLLAGDRLIIQVSLTGSPEQFAEYLSLRPALADEGRQNAQGMTVWRSYRWER